MVYLFIYVTKYNPDIIFMTNFTQAQPKDLYNNTIGSNDWSKVKAVEDKKVYKMPLGMYRSYTPGADTPMTLLWLAKTTYPDKFKDIDLTKEVKDYYKDYVWVVFINLFHVNWYCVIFFYIVSYVFSSYSFCPPATEE